MANFDINGVELNVGGLSIKDQIVSFEFVPEGDAYADEVSADGKSCSYATGETRATLNLVLKGYSIHNAQLSAIHAGDRSATNGLGILPMFFKDGNGTTSIAGTCRILALPGATFTNKREDVTWKIRLFLNAPLQYIIGGNS
jgi:hypothetical protein